MVIVRFVLEENQVAVDVPAVDGEKIFGVRKVRRKNKGTVIIDAKVGHCIVAKMWIGRNTLTIDQLKTSEPRILRVLDQNQSLGNTSQYDVLDGEMLLRMQVKACELWNETRIVYYSNGTPTGKVTVIDQLIIQSANSVKQFMRSRAKEVRAAIQNDGGVSGNLSLWKEVGQGNEHVEPLDLMVKFIRTLNEMFIKNETAEAVINANADVTENEGGGGGEIVDFVPLQLDEASSFVFYEPVCFQEEGFDLHARDASGFMDEGGIQFVREVKSVEDLKPAWVDVEDQLLDEDCVGLQNVPRREKIVVASGHNGNMYLYSTSSKEMIDTLTMTGDVTDLNFNSNGGIMYSTGSDGEIFKWDMNTRSCVGKFRDHGAVSSTKIAASESFVACGSNAGVVNIYPNSNSDVDILPAVKPQKAFMNLVTPVSVLDFNTQGELLAMGSSDKINALKLVHVPSLSVFSKFPQLNMFSPNSGYFSLGNNKDVKTP